MKKIPKDNRGKFWAEIEADIQTRGDKKDKKFAFEGKWKKFIRTQDGFKIFAVESTWVRNNLSVIFGHGGHGYVHEFIPPDEIWITTHHFHENKWSECGCKNIKANQLVSKEYFDSCVIHEIMEFKEMTKGKPYWTAHNIALDKEREAGLLPDPNTDIRLP